MRLVAEPQNMIGRTQSLRFLSNRKARRERLLRRMAAMRAAKERKRLANPIEPEPRMERWFPLQLGLRDKRTCETAWVDFVSILDAVRRLRVVRAEYGS